MALENDSDNNNAFMNLHTDRKDSDLSGDSDFDINDRENGDSSKSETEARNILSGICVSLWQFSKPSLQNIQKCIRKFPRLKQLLVKTGISTIFYEHPKPGGLHNSQSTCYMNAMIQALSSSDVLINALEDLKESHLNSSLLLLCDLLNALNEENINNETVMRNTNLLEDLIKSVGWTKLSQQDAFELLSALFSDIYKKSSDNYEIEIPLKIKLLHEFQGLKIPNKVHKYLGLSLNLCGDYANRPGMPLEYLINQHFVSTTIDDDDSKLTRLSLYKEIPNILLVHIQANKWDTKRRQMIKPIYYIKYDEKMTLRFDIVNEINRENQNLNEDRVLNTEVEYHLKSVVYHTGNISGGHYVTYRRWRNEWYLADDESIKKEPLNKTISPYIMIYEKSL